MEFIRHLLGWQENSAAVSPPSSQQRYNNESMLEIKQSLRLLKSKMKKKQSEDNSYDAPYKYKSNNKNNNYQDSIKLPNIKNNQINPRSKSVNQKNAKFEVLTRNHVPARTYQLQEEVETKAKDPRRKFVNKPINTSLQDPYEKYHKVGPTQRKVSSHPPVVNNQQQGNNYNIRYRGRTLNNSVHTEDRIIPTLRKPIQREDPYLNKSNDYRHEDNGSKSFKYKFNEDLERQYMMQIERNGSIKNGNRYSENQPINYKPVQVATKVQYDSHRNHQPISKSLAIQKRKIERNIPQKQIKYERERQQPKHIRQEPVQTKHHTKQIRQPYQRQVQNHVNQLQEIPIAKLKKQNQFIQNPKAFDPNQLMECRAGCGRKFNPDSIQKHQKICYKVFSKKRKQFDAQQHRLVSNEQAKYVEMNEIKQQRNPPKQQKMSKWKMQSLAFRAAMKKNRNQELSKNEQMVLQNAQSSSQIKCPHCGRTFNEDSGQRHIKVCAANALKRR